MSKAWYTKVAWTCDEDKCEFVKRLYSFAQATHLRKIPKIDYEKFLKVNHN